MTTDYETYTNLRVERSGRILTVMLDRPERYNAIDHDLHEELARIFDDVGRDDAADVIVLTGAGKAFCAGGDLRAMHEHAIARRSGGHYMNVTSGKRIVNSLLDLEKPILAKINGPAVGLGATIALLCDVSFIAEDASIGDPHVAAGVVAGDGGAIIWPQLIGHNRAKEYLMTGDMIPARLAADMGLVNHCVPREELDGTVRSFAERLANGPTAAIRWTKTAVNIGLKHAAASALDASLGYEVVTMRSPSHLEALQAFVEKRTPDFTGM